MSSRYQTIVQANEVLRARLGSYGLPTEATPEEDMDLQDLHSRFEVAKKENEKLRSTLTSYSGARPANRFVFFHHWSQVQFQRRIPWRLGTLTCLSSFSGKCVEE